MIIPETRNVTPEHFSDELSIRTMGRFRPVQSTQIVMDDSRTAEWGYHLSFWVQKTKTVA